MKPRVGPLAPLYDRKRQAKKSPAVRGETNRGNSRCFGIPRVRGCDALRRLPQRSTSGIPPRAWVRHYLLWSISHSTHYVVGFLRSSRGGAALRERQFGAACPYRHNGEMLYVNGRIDIAVVLGPALRAGP